MTLLNKSFISNHVSESVVRRVIALWLTCRSATFVFSFLLAVYKPEPQPFPPVVLLFVCHML